MSFKCAYIECTMGLRKMLQFFDYYTQSHEKNIIVYGNQHASTLIFCLENNKMFKNKMHNNMLLFG